ncbi:MAG TPA: hypothetical protein VIG95_02690, partial [Gemmatimonadales bacterium]
MHFNIHVLPPLRGLLLVLAILCRPVESLAQTSCPPGTATAIDAGWRAYRTAALEKALSGFEQANRLCPANGEALSGLGFVSLRRGQTLRADSLFRLAAELSPNNSDAWDGRTRSAIRLGDTLAAVVAGRRAMALAPTNQELRELLDRVVPEWNRQATTTESRPSSLQVVARTHGREFEIATPNGWAPFYIRGVNLGVALPGKYPSEFPLDSARYGGWLDTLSAMHANLVRVYTILPPGFYRALRGWNLSHPDRAVRLIHGVWAELPPRHDFNEPRWKAEFQRETRRVVDVIHGAARIAVRPGHAGGRFDADVSPWVLAYIIGREWEPFAVKAFNAGHPPQPFVGRFLELGSGPAMDLWLTQQCDLMLSYEADTYNALRPIAYTNWPTLDPLYH